MNVVIVHGCPGNEEKEKTPETRTYNKHWLYWLKEKLIDKGIACETPLMPEPWNPKYEDWKNIFDGLNIGKETVLVGHSCGCAFLVRWLGDTRKKIKKLILVAPWKIRSDEFTKGENELYDFEIFPAIKDNVKKVLIFTSDDEDEDGKKSAKIFEESLKGKLIEMKNKGHFVFGDMGTNEFPDLLEEILK
ncbi:MAG: alpha/beta hydrolase [Nanoarchaeota archaeon]|nr:alpha/beta hydrolase [Nanoarchaeota archaeon]